MGVAAHAARHQARKRQLPAQALAEMAAEGFAMLAPARLQVRIKILRRALPRMDVAMDETEPLRGLGLAFRHRFVHRAISLRIGACRPASLATLKRGYVASGLSTRILRSMASDSPSGNASSPSNCQCG